MLEDIPDDFVFPPGITQPLGELVISYPQIQRQALENNNSILKELSFITGHGILHLAGYDHEEPDETAMMKSKEVEILSLIDFEAHHDI
jgi:probable rRNA maturation factor